ncbi:unnamed protein product [Discula destructiva]
MTAVLPSGSPGIAEDDDSQSWDFVSGAYAASFAGSGSGSGDYGLTAPSPSVHSQGSWVNITNNAAAAAAAAGHSMRSLSTPSPIMSHALSTSPYSVDGAFGPSSVSNMDGGNSAAMFEYLSAQHAAQHQQHQQQQQQQQHQHQQFNTQPTQPLFHEQIAGFTQQSFVFSPTPPENLVLSGFNMSFEFSLLPDSPYPTALDQAAHFAPLGIPPSMQGSANSMPWAPTSVGHDVLASEHFTPPPPPPPPPPVAARSTGTSSASLSPRSPAVKQEPRAAHNKTTNPQPIHSHSHSHKKPGGIQKTQQQQQQQQQQQKKKKKKSQTSPRSSASNSPDHGKLADGILMFCNQTVDNWGKGVAFGEMENIERSSQKGRKGALSEEVRANALRVRQTGACFCCHWRKVKCDDERPCQKCKRLCMQVPEAACWKFQDFNSVLFPDFLRGHFRREETSKFVEANVASFTIDGVEAPAVVALSSGPTFNTKLVVKAKFFTAKDVSSDVMQQWFQFTGTNGEMELEALRAAPIGLDINADSASASPASRNELRRKVEAYVDGLVAEPTYALRLTDSIRKSDIPRKVLLLVQQYAQASGASIVRRALAIYTMHYVMTRQLTMTQQTIASLQGVNPVAAMGPFLTPRLLNRQIKMVVDDIMQQEVNVLFDDFTKRLKKKDRKEWAPCLAAFLVFTMLMEAIETAADVYTIADNETAIRNLQPARFRRAEALEINERIEKLPFKQFAYQFHYLYQTHERDASGKAFNPLTGQGVDDLVGLGPGAVDLVLGLQSMLQCDWSELDWLSCDPILPDGEGHPYPMNVEENYAGRLLSKLILSFDDRPIFG